MRLIGRGMSKCYIIILSLFIFSCGIKEENIKDKKTNKEVDLIDQFHWLVGIWVDTNTFRNKYPSGHYIEKWSMNKDSVFGVGLKVIGNDTSITRYMSIRELNDTPVFIERELDHAMISYYFTKSDSSSFAFTNKAQIFPRDILYNKRSNDSLIITLKGVADEREMGIRMHFKKIGS